MSRKRKSLQELTIMDGFLFGAVMMDPENCRILLERILEIPIARVDVIQEKSLIYHPEYKGIRMDVFAKDEEGVFYRNSKVYRIITDKKTDEEIKKELILDNHSKVMYDYELIPKEQIRAV